MERCVRTLRRGRARGRVRRRRDGALEVLRGRIDAIEIDRAPFERIDAYVRAACGRLAPGGDEPVPFVEES